MSIVAVPFFMGNPMAHFRVPEPHTVLNPPLPDADPLTRMGVLYRHLAEIVADVDQPVTYAGDCVSAIGVLAGLQRRGIDPTLVWLDAHGDFNTPDTSPSGFPGGMPLAMITGRGEQTVVDAVGLTPLPDDRVILVDARNLDPGESAAVAESGVTQVAVVCLVDHIPTAGAIHVHLDGDVVDPTDMPANNYPAADGPSLEEVRAALASLADTGRVVALSVSSWNPELPGAERAAEAMLTLVEPFLGQGEDAADLSAK